MTAPDGDMTSEVTRGHGQRLVLNLALFAVSSEMLMSACNDMLSRERVPSKMSVVNFVNR